MAREASKNDFKGDYHLSQLNLTAMKSILRSAPMEGNAVSNQPTRVTLPMPDGSLEVFEVVNSPVMRPQLAAKFPEIQSFIGRSIKDPQHIARIGYGHKGFYAAFETEQGLIATSIYAEGQEEYYASYFIQKQEDSESPKCGYDDLEHAIEATPFGGIELTQEMKNQMSIGFRGDSEPVDLIVYDMAVACVGEFGQRQGGTVAAVMSDFNLALGILNMFYEQEMAIRFMLVPNNDILIFLDPATDNYSDVTNGGGLLQQNRVVLDGLIGHDNYDIGHVFTIGCGGGLAGVASGNTCTQNKGRGVTCFNSINIIGRVTNTMTHEVGHQFTAGHTWNICSDDLAGQRAGGSAFEPGSGSTIMSYQGACPGNNISGASGQYFHVGSLDQMFFHSRLGNGSTCPDIVSTNNNTPSLELPYPDGLYIPPSTPFELTAISEDPDNDPITYCWEQYNSGPAIALGMVFGSSPAYRSYDPTPNPTRVFPPMTTIVNNRFNQDDENLLIDYDRALNFRCTVRDNNPEVGGVQWEEVEFRVTTTADPFRVTFPTVTTTFEVGDYIEVKWAVANTDNNLINCQRVNVKLSIDGGFTYPITLAENVPNIGSRFITIPDNVTTSARVRVEAADNIFFDISNNNFIILPPSAPGYTLDVTPFTQQVCLPGGAEIDLITSSLLDYDSLITFEVNGLPNGAVSSFSSNPVMPSDGSILSLDLANVIEDDTFAIEIIAIAPGADTSYRTIYLEVVNNDFSLLEQLTPTDGEAGLSELPTFTWVASPNANAYDIEIATSPTFEASTMIDQASNIVGTSYAPATLLEKGTPHFWRVRPVNECGAGDFENSHAFHTETLSCANFSSNNVPVFIPSAGTPTIESELTLNQGGAISDLNVTNMRGQHNLVKHLDFFLVSPEGTEVLLMSDKCGNTQLFDLGFDDQAPTGVPCPPNDGQVHTPDSSLSLFNNENSEGTWRLKMVVNDNFGEGGALQEWGLQICSSVSLSAPFLVNNEKLAVKPGEGNPIYNDLLLSEDNDNTAEELIYTIVSNTTSGTVYLRNSPIGLGDEFTQSDIDNGDLRYAHNGNTAMTDAFQFTVRDGEGGWFGAPLFEIEIDENATTGTSELEAARQIRVYPNPAQQELNIVFLDNQRGELQLSLIDIQGRELIRQEAARSLNQLQLNISSLPVGIYFLRVQSDAASVTKKVTIQR